MITPGPGVWLSANVAGVVALALSDYVARTRIVDHEVLIALDELKALGPVSARSAHERNSADLPVEWLKIDDEAAAAYDVSKQTLRRWAKDGLIPAYREGATWRIARTSPTATPR